MKLKLNDCVYDVLKWMCLVCLPAASVFYTALDASFGWGYASTVQTVTAAVCAFVGALIGVSTVAYNEDKDSEGDK